MQDAILAKTKFAANLLLYRKNESQVLIPSMAFFMNTSRQHGNTFIMIYRQITKKVLITK